MGWVEWLFWVYVGVGWKEGGGVRKESEFGDGWWGKRFSLSLAVYRGERSPYSYFEARAAFSMISARATALESG